ncbi:THUMP domain-containing class I SAM-dependent RNA methyltransferase [Acetobacter thailandicus]|uniref:THUMP domain-containing class I SAM-dependent RNA methyltransferase n=1 Tax=Acetobacter thailandicus TaxID=1502842 RepID=UPI001BACE44B|nr:THUMP domain-containing protein [Acetobacter thailandicus]MBS1002381.1 class I SAM-dependent RNA methyltransferase [Acetobacter thailandicus]
MTYPSEFDIFLATTPGLEPVLCNEVRLKGFKQARIVPGGVTIKGGWPEVWRANLWIRGTSKILARVLSFPARHLSQLERRAQTFEWGKLLPADKPFRVEATCARSRIYHAGAASERIARAITASMGAPGAETAEITVKARIEDDICTISIDTSGELLHRRGSKEAVNRAPLRETLASLFLMQCGYTGAEPVFDPMCGSGTFITEAAEIAARLNPGRARHFAFEQLVPFDKEAWEKMRAVKSARLPSCRFYGSDRDAGAIVMSEANAKRAGVDSYTAFACQPVSEISPPEGEAPGLVICNPPYGTRLGDKTQLAALYRAFGNTMKARFSGWRVAIITSESSLAHATTLPFLPVTAPVPHGGLRISLYQTRPLP